MSSAEAELIAMCELSAEMLGLISMAWDLGEKLKGAVHADSSAAIAITKRWAAGKLRHINIRLLWIQEKEKAKELEFHKVKGTSNPADLMTKHVSQQLLKKHAEALGQVGLDGRASSGLLVQGRKG